MRAGLIRRSCMSHFTHTAQATNVKDVCLTSIDLSCFFCCFGAVTWSVMVRGGWQQQVEVLSVSSLLLKPRLQHGFHGEHVVFHSLQVDLHSQHQTVCRRQLNSLTHREPYRQSPDWDLNRGASHCASHQCTISPLSLSECICRGLYLSGHTTETQQWVYSTQQYRPPTTRWQQTPINAPWL